MAHKPKVESIHTGLDSKELLALFRMMAKEDKETDAIAGIEKMLQATVQGYQEEECNVGPINDMGTKSENWPKFRDDIELLEGYEGWDSHFLAMLLSDIRRNGQNIRSVSWNYFFEKGSHCDLISIMTNIKFIKEMRTALEVLKLWKALIDFLLNFSEENKSIAFGELMKQGIVEGLLEVLNLFRSRSEEIKLRVTALIMYFYWKIGKEDLSDIARQEISVDPNVALLLQKIDQELEDEEKHQNAAASGKSVPKEKEDNLDAELAKWIQNNVGVPVNATDLIESLRSGVILCKLLNAIRVGAVAAFNESPSMPLYEMENISLYIKACWQLGVPSGKLFVISDLYQKQDVNQVYINLISLAQLANTMPGFKGTKFSFDSKSQILKLVSPIKEESVDWQLMETFAKKLDAQDNGDLMKQLMKVQQQMESYREEISVLKKLARDNLMYGIRVQEDQKRKRPKNEGSEEPSEPAEPQRRSADDENMRFERDFYCRKLAELRKQTDRERDSSADEGELQQYISSRNEGGPEVEIRPAAHKRAQTVRKSVVFHSNQIEHDDKGDLFLSKQFRSSEQSQILDSINTLINSIIFDSESVTIQDINALGGNFKHENCRRQFAYSLKTTAESDSNGNGKISNESFELLLYLTHLVLHEVELCGDKDFVSAKLLMHVSVRLYRTSDYDDTKEYISDYIKGYSIWKNLVFWEEYYWEMLTKKHRKSMKKLSLGINSIDTVDKGKVIAEGQEESKMDSAMIMELLGLFVRRMYEWTLPYEDLKRFVVLICDRTSVPEAAGIEALNTVCAALVKETKKEQEKEKKKRKATFMFRKRSLAPKPNTSRSKEDKEELALSTKKDVRALDKEKKAAEKLKKKEEKEAKRIKKATGSGATFRDSRKTVPTTSGDGPAVSAPISTTLKEPPKELVDAASSPKSL